MPSDDPTPRELARYRSRLLSDDRDVLRAAAQDFAQLAETHHARFLRLCYALLDEIAPHARVRAAVLGQLRRRGDRDDPIAENKVLALLSVPELRRHALLALGTAGTAAAVPIVYEHCLAGELCALEAFAHQSRTPAQRDEALRLSREWLLSPIYRRRDEALWALRVLSTAEDEEETLVHAYQLYGDELVARALGSASARMLPFLYEHLRRLPVGCAEHGDIARAIGRLKRRIARGEPAGSATGADYWAEVFAHEYL
jgi:hypothetical protein